MGPLSVVLALLVVTAAVCDQRTQRIPNLLVYPGAALALAAHVAMPEGSGASFAALGCAVGLLAFLPFYALGTMGAGDVKLMAMAGAWLGPGGALSAALLAMLAGGLLALAVAVGRRSLGLAFDNVRTMLRQVPGRSPSGSGFHPPASSAGKLPYGVAIAVGTLAELALAAAGLGIM